MSRPEYTICRGVTFVKKLVLKVTQNGCIFATEQDYISPKIIFNSFCSHNITEKVRGGLFPACKLIMEYVIGLKKHGILDLI